jgi:hypothetical protein
LEGRPVVILTTVGVRQGPQEPRDAHRRR